MARRVRVQGAVREVATLLAMQVLMATLICTALGAVVLWSWLR